MPTLERSNPLPLYYQLKEVLKQQIRAGHLAPHTAIPSEPELVSSYHVSRATVRQALTELVHEGLLYRQHGKGTFVCEQLRLTDTEQAIRLERLRSADGTMVAYEVDYFPYPLAAGIYERAKVLADGSLYSLMATEGFSPYIAEQKLKADRPSSREAEFLRLEAGEPGLRLTCTTFDQSGLH